MLKNLKYEDLQDLLGLTRPKNVFFIKGDWNVKVGSQEASRITGKFGLLLGWRKQKLESRWPGEIPITSYMQMIPPLWQKVKKN